MYHSRYVPGQSSSAVRKSKYDGKPSLLPRRRNGSSTDQLANESKRPSTMGYRSSSADPPRSTVSGARMSRETSASKIPPKRRSQSQQRESRSGLSMMTPLHSNQYGRQTDMGTPADERLNRPWQTSLDRVIAFVTIKDLRPISTVPWQRAENARVMEGLMARSFPGDVKLIRPLTIARFVEITGMLLSAITGESKLNNDNYVTKLPHQTKRLLYPGTVSKSWLRTVNTLHAYPQALALIGYLLDLANHIQTPVSDEELYQYRDEVDRLHHDYLTKCWIRFQSPNPEYDDLSEEYLQNLKSLLGDDKKRIAEIEQQIQKLEVDRIEIESEGGAAREEHARRSRRRDELCEALRVVRADCAAARAAVEEHQALASALTDTLHALHHEIEQANAEKQRVCEELVQQPMSMSERLRLQEEIRYLKRVRDSRRTLVDQVLEMTLREEQELAACHKRTLDSCVEYNRALIHLSTQFPELSTFTIDETELASERCSSRVVRDVERLREIAAELRRQRHERHADKVAHHRRHQRDAEEIREKILQLKKLMEPEQLASEAELSAEAAEAQAWDADQLTFAEQLERTRAALEEKSRTEREMEFMEKQISDWRAQMSELSEYTANKKMETRCVLEEARGKRAALVRTVLHKWNDKLNA